MFQNVDPHNDDFTRESRTESGPLKRYGGLARGYGDLSQGTLQPSLITQRVCKDHGNNGDVKTRDFVRMPHLASKFEPLSWPFQRMELGCGFGGVNTGETSLSGVDFIPNRWDRPILRHAALKA